MITSTIADLMRFPSNYTFSIPTTIVGTFEMVVTGLLAGVGASELAFRTFEKVKKIPTSSTAQKLVRLTFPILGVLELFSFCENMWWTNPNDRIVTLYYFQASIIATVAAAYFSARTKDYWSTLTPLPPAAPPPPAGPLVAAAAPAA